MIFRNPISDLVSFRYCKTEEREIGADGPFLAECIGYSTCVIWLWLLWLCPVQGAAGEIIATPSSIIDSFYQLESMYCVDNSPFEMKCSSAYQTTISNVCDDPVTRAKNAMTASFLLYTE